MALINCPECNHTVSDSAEMCPNCGYKLADHCNNPHIPKKTTLSRTRKIGVSKSVLTLIGGCLLIAIGIPLISIGIGVVLIILGVIGAISSLTEVKKYQYGPCPYCGTELRVTAGNSNFKCPVCNNMGVQTDTSLETTHDYTLST